MTFRELENFVKRHHISYDVPIVVHTYDGFLTESDSFTLDKMELSLGEKKEICIVIE